MSGQRPLSPRCLAAGEACGAVADGGLFTRKATGGKLPEEISDEGAPQGNSCAAGPTQEGLDGPERTRTIRQDSSQTRKTLLQPERSEALFRVLKGLRPAPWGRPQFSLSKRKLSAAASSLQRTYRSSGDFSQEILTMGAPGCGMVNIESSRTS